jgi:hypothetical protein
MKPLKRRRGENPIDYIKIRMKNALIVGVTFAGVTLLKRLRAWYRQRRKPL